MFARRHGATLESSVLAAFYVSGNAVLALQLHEVALSLQLLAQSFRIALDDGALPLRTTRLWKQRFPISYASAAKSGAISSRQVYTINQARYKFYHFFFLGFTI